MAKQNPQTSERTVGDTVMCKAAACFAGNKEIFLSTLVATVRKSYRRKDGRAVECPAVGQNNGEKNIFKSNQCNAIELPG